MRFLQAGQRKDLYPALRVQSYRVTGDKKTRFSNCVRAVDKEMIAKEKGLNKSTPFMINKLHVLFMNGQHRHFALIDHGLGMLCFKQSFIKIMAPGGDNNHVDILILRKKVYRFVKII